MLKVETTPHMFGISLYGDYFDLNEIYDSLSRYLDFYQENEVGCSYDDYEYLLSLNYDIRHAYMGTRGKTRQKDNHGNIYFHVEILYPLVFHYLAAFESILDDGYHPDWFEKRQSKCEDDPYLQTYDEITALHDQSQIRFFVSLLWQNIASLFGTEETVSIYHYACCQEYRFVHPIYTDALLHYSMVHFHTLSDTQKKDFLKVCLYEELGSEELLDLMEENTECRSAYSESLASLSKASPAFQTKEQFYQSFELAFCNKQPIYEDDFEQFLDQVYGTVRTEEPDW